MSSGEGGVNTRVGHIEIGCVCGDERLLILSKYDDSDTGDLQSMFISALCIGKSYGKPGLQMRLLLLFPRDAGDAGIASSTSLLLLLLFEVEEEEQRVVNICNCFVDEEEECFEDDDDEERKRFEKDDAQHEEDATARIVVVV